MSDIKSVIATLCKHLKELYGCDLRNEHFRLAKFDQTDKNTVNHFWQLLYKICSDENKYNIFKNENTVDFVKLNMAILKYDSLPFYTLPSDMSCGSRELLLAFAWLLATTDILEKATKKKIVNSYLSKESGSPDLSSITESTAKNINSQSVRKTCRNILWYAGKINDNLNAIDELSQDWIEIITKIHDDTLNICGLPHLSAGDAKLIYDTKDSPMQLDHLKDGASILESYRHWSRKTEIFWEWMRTVIAERDDSSVDSFGPEARHVLLCFVEVLRKKIEVIKNVLKSNVSQPEVNTRNFEEIKCTEIFKGVPRYILQDGDHESDVEKMLLDSTRQIIELDAKYKILLKDAQNFLESFSEKMSGVTILHI